jgi:hypothetical protein
MALKIDKPAGEGGLVGEFLGTGSQTNLSMAGRRYQFLGGDGQARVLAYPKRPVLSLRFSERAP